VNRKESGIIKKIQYGLDISKPSLTIQVGSPVRAREGYFICEIVEDKNTFIEYGYFEYLIMISKLTEGKPDKDSEYFWKRYLAKPDMVEYFFQDEIEELFL